MFLNPDHIMQVVTAQDRAIQGYVGICQHIPQPFANQIKKSRFKNTIKTYFMCTQKSMEQCSKPQLVDDQFGDYDKQCLGEYHNPSSRHQPTSIPMVLAACSAYSRLLRLSPSHVLQVTEKTGKIRH